MITSLYIENFILIEKAFIEFDVGFSALTGETGAGKSIILDALKIVLGDKISSKLMLNNNKPMVLTAEFDISHNISINQILEALGIKSSDQLIIRRTFSPEGKSRAFVNDNTITQDSLQQLGKLLLEICGQNDHHSLMSTSMHRDTLDSYLNLEAVALEVARTFKEWQQAELKLKDLHDKQRRLESEKEYLQHVIHEIESLNYTPNEENDLAIKRQHMIQASKAQELIQEADQIWQHNNPLQQINKLSKLLAKKPDLFESAISALERAALEMNEAQAQIESLAELEFDEAELQRLDNRFFTVKTIAKKYGIEAERFPLYLEEKRVELLDFTNIENLIDDTQKYCKVVNQNYHELARKLSSARKEGAVKLEKSVMQELAELKMNGASFFVCLKPLEANQHGFEKVVFEVMTNPNSKADSLQNIASGGEISRIMLALKVALSNIKSIPTIIFDEIDTGIGGIVAGSVGKKLAALGKNRQVLTITHQPQIAAIASKQYSVKKIIQNNISQVEIKLLNQDERITEITRMLAGDNISNQVREVAISMISGENVRESAA
jgi:DNA repair protein RecN (Recombination protein N)